MKNDFHNPKQLIHQELFIIEECHNENKEGCIIHDVFKTSIIYLVN